MTHEARNASIRDQASRLLLEITAEQRKWIADQRAWLDGQEAKLNLLEAIAGQGRRVRAMHRMASRVQEGQTRPSVPKSIRTALERASATLDKLAASIKAAPVTATERTLQQVARRKE